MAAANAVQLPPGIKFDPDDDELVEHYLVPRQRGQPLPFEGIIVEADPLSSPPRKLLDKYERKDVAFFFARAAGQAKSGNGKGGHQKRTCEGGGCWKKQKGVEGRTRLATTGEEVVWRNDTLNFHAEGDNSSSGWVMHEYTITAPPELASSPLRAYRINFGWHGQKRKRETQGSGVADDGDGDAGARAAQRRATAPCIQQGELQGGGGIVSSPAAPMIMSECVGASSAATPSSEQDPYTAMTDLDFDFGFEIPENIDELLQGINNDD